ncbi:unnamed protein product [marine sediment metagenome]|uniref:DUF1508 domain-containing protein n=1 Tax=marine sediment metagenome TaxID=412755 RepID=X0VMF1_9ZZZZ
MAISIQIRKTAEGEFAAAAFDANGDLLAVSESSSPSHAIGSVKSAVTRNHAGSSEKTASAVTFSPTRVVRAFSI